MSVMTADTMTEGAKYIIPKNMPATESEIRYALESLVEEQSALILDLTSQLKTAESDLVFVRGCADASAKMAEHLNERLQTERAQAFREVEIIARSYYKGTPDVPDYHYDKGNDDAVLKIEERLRALRLKIER